MNKNETRFALFSYLDQPKITANDLVTVGGTFNMKMTMRLVEGRPAGEHATGDRRHGRVRLLLQPARRLQGRHQQQGQPHQKVLMTLAYGLQHSSRFSNFKSVFFGGGQIFL